MDHEANKRAAEAFYRLLFDEDDPRQAVARFVGARYTQHNPHVADGPEGLIAYFQRMSRAYPGRRVEIKRTLADGPFVILHCLQRWPTDRDYASIDIFRFDGAGRIVEHWDVLQPMPETSANPNGMF